MIVLVNFNVKETQVLVNTLALENFKQFSVDAFLSYEIIGNEVFFFNDLSEILLEKKEELSANFTIEISSNYLDGFSFKSLNSESLKNIKAYIKQNKKFTKKENQLFSIIKQANFRFKELITSLEENLFQTKIYYKKMREILIKDFGSFSIKNLFKVGLNSGSEIQEIIETQSDVLWIFASTNNYDTSSEIYALITDLYNQKTLSINIVLDLLDGKITSREKKELNFAVLQINKSTLSVSAHLFGDFYFLSSNKKNIYFPKKIPFEKEFYSSAHESIQLEREEKFLIISPGVLKNTDLEKSHDQLLEFYLKHIKTSNDDILDEIMLDLSKLQKGKFFEYDACLGYLEVPENAIFTIS